MSDTGTGELLRLPEGHRLHSFMPDQVPAPGAIYLAMMPGDLETLFGPARELRDREFLLEVDGQPWVATPVPDFRAASDGERLAVFDMGTIVAGTTGEQTSIDFELVRPAGEAGRDLMTAARGSVGRIIGQRITRPGVPGIISECVFPAHAGWSPDPRLGAELRGPFIVEQRIIPDGLWAKVAEAPDGWRTLIWDGGIEPVAYDIEADLGII